MERSLWRAHDRAPASQAPRVNSTRGCRIRQLHAAERANPSSVSEPPMVTSALLDQLPEVVRRRHVELVVRARLRIAVGPPPLEDAGVAQPPSLHLVVADLEHAFRPQLHEGGVAIGRSEAVALLVAGDR